MEVLLTILSIGVVWLLVIFLTVEWILGDRKRRAIKSPVGFALARQPGESLRNRYEKLFEKLLFGQLLGVTAALLLLCVPYQLANTFGWKEAWLTSAAALTLLFAGLVTTIRWGIRSGKKLQQYRLGMAGERAVAEALQELSIHGYYIFHDVPMITNGKVTENLDHVAVGPHGVILIETKTRGIDIHQRLRESTVTFDGERLIWPRWGNDFGTVKQVQRGAAWLSGWLKEHCALEITVHQMIAIPGWHVTPGNFYNPRVVSADAVASAFLNVNQGKPMVLKPREVTSVARKLKEINRTEGW